LKKALVSIDVCEGINKHEKKYNGDKVMMAMKDLIKEYIYMVISKVPAKNYNVYKYYDGWFKCCSTWQHISFGTYFFKINHLEPNNYIDCWERNEKSGTWKNKYTNEVRTGVIDKNPAYKYIDCWNWSETSGNWKNKHTNEIRQGTIDNNPVSPSLSNIAWYIVNLRCWSDIVNSIFLMRHNRHFCEHFGKAISDLEWTRWKQNVTDDPIETKKCFNCRKQMPLPSALVAARKRSSRIPDHVSDPDHWGHLIWMFCNFLENSQVAEK